MNEEQKAIIQKIKNMQFGQDEIIENKTVRLSTFDQSEKIQLMNLEGVKRVGESLDDLIEIPKEYFHGE